MFALQKNLSAAAALSKTFANTKKRALMTEYLPWLFVLLVFGMMAWPILQLMPSDGQKRRVVIRQQAKDAGLVVSIEKIKLPEALADSYRHLDNAVNYRLEQRTGLRKRLIAIRSNRDKSQWFWLEGLRPETHLIEPLLEQYQRLPTCIDAIEHGPNGHSIFWLEQSAQLNVTEIKALLQPCQAIFKP